MLRRFVLGLGAAALIGAASAPAAAANTLQANCTNFGTTLASAGAGDTIILSGLCQGQSHTLPATANLTIEGAATGTNGFDGNGAGAPALSGTTSNGLTLRNLTFENYASAGVSVVTMNVGNPYAIIGDTFSNNSNPSMTSGGGLNLSVHNFSGCLAGQPSATISGSTFTGNSTVGAGFGPIGLGGGGGGGAFVDLECSAASPTLNLSGNTFSGNHVLAPSSQPREGGGLFVAVGGFNGTGPINDTQTGNTFSGNSVTGSGGSYSGGGEFTVGANVTSSGDRYLNNSLAGSTTSTVSSEGGGLATRSGGNCTSPSGATAQATNLVVSGNSIGAPSGTGTGGEGAGVYAGCTIGTGGYNLTLNNSTVSGNQASGSGAVAGVDGEATDLLHLQNTILFGNPGGSDIDGFGASPGANVTAANSDVCAVGGGGPFAGAGNICADPALVNAAAGDIKETASSPTIDKGDNAFAAGIATDVFGGPRILVGRPGDAAIVDMGAFEFKLPSNHFEIVGLKGKTLFVTLDSPGRVVVTQTGAGSSAAVEAKKKRKKRSKRLLNPSSASGGPGQVAIPLLLTKKGKQRLKKKGKVSLNATVTFTPTGGEANSKTTALKIKGKKKNKK